MNLRFHEKLGELQTASCIHVYKLIMHENYRRENV